MGSKPDQTNLPHKIKIAAKAIGILLLAGIIISYNIFFSKSFVQKMIINGFESASNGKISLEVTKASLFRGFTIENLEILSGPDFDGKPIVKVEKINIAYNLASFFAGDIGFHEIGIYKPAVFLNSKNNIWNFETLMKSSDEEPEEAEDTESTAQAFELPVSIRLFLKFVLEDFSLTVNNESVKSDGFHAGIKGFTFHTYFVSDKFDRIPYNPTEFLASGLVKTFYANMDPQKVVDVYYENASSLSRSPLTLHWLLSTNDQKGKNEFFSRLKIGSSNAPVTYRGKHALPLDFFIDYELEYQPELDRLSLDFFRIRFKEDTWMNFTGFIDSATDSKNMKINIDMDKSKIDLAAIHPYYRAFTQDEDMKFGGIVSLAPIKIKGPMNNLSVKGDFSIRNAFAYTSESNSRISKLDLYYDSLFDITKEGIPVIFAKLGWDGKFNGSPLGARVEYRPEQKVYIKTFIKQFNPYQYSGRSVNGNFDFDLTVQGPNEKSLKSTVNLSSQYFRYYIDKGRSGTNRLKFRLEAIMESPDTTYNNVEIRVPVLNFALRNKEYFKTVWMNSDASIKKEGERIDSTFNLKNFSFNLFDLYPSLTYSLQETLDSVAKKLHKDVVFTGTTSVSMNGDDLDLNHFTRGRVEDFDINDLTFKAVVNKKGTRADIPVINLHGLQDALDFNVNGHLNERVQYNKDSRKQESSWVPNLIVKFFFGKDERSRIFQNQTIEGKVNLFAKVVDNIIDGKLNIDKFYYDSGGFTRINNINMEFPFRHNTRLKKTLNLKSVNKENLITEYKKDIDFNFTIDSIEAEVSSKPNQPTKIIYPLGPYSGFSASVYYKDNVFHMPLVQIYMLNGLTVIKESLFNVGRGELSEMEYLLKAQVKNIDLKRVMPSARAKSIEDGEVSFDINISGNRLDQPLENTVGYLSVYKMGKQFSIHAAKIIIPEAKSVYIKVANSQFAAYKMEARLDEGLVYAHVYGYKKTPVISFEKNTIAENRIPITEFLQRTANEVKVYRVEKTQYEKDLPEREE